ncbi:MAG: Scaffold-type E3 ligase [Lichina confinis]|nr:MAG: Scaffold-type E3 ligase [Lichina confinis]
MPAPFLPDAWRRYLNIPLFQETFLRLKMPSAYSSEHKAKLQQFVAITSTTERTAAKGIRRLTLHTNPQFLKVHGWDVERAADGYYHSAGKIASGYGRADAPSLNELFEKYRDDESDAGRIGTDGTMLYMNDLNVRLDDLSVFIVGEVLQCPTMGEITREGFVQGWTKLSADTLPKQQVAVANLRTEIAQNDELFKRVYKYTFDLARQPQQKSIDLAAAIEYWRTVFAPSGGRGWFSEKTNFLDQWLAYLERDWKKSVNRDMWNMTYEFYTRTLADDSLAWWDEMGAWPSVIDGFAVYLKRQNAGDAPAEQDDNM